MASDTESDKELSLDSDSAQFLLEAESEYMVQSSAMKPQIESIFAEVEKTLPTIDFEISDVCTDMLSCQFASCLT